ncbi:MAG: hypothetical protein NT153_08345 [Bacteroidetes bacterium]|nr:hypothetical protein [Bacteroidota bacterium]
MKYYFVIVLLVIICGSCNNQSAPKQTTDSVVLPAVPVKDPATIAAENASLLKQYNSLEKVFDNQNWVVIRGKDTSYLYLSRLNNFLILAHNFTIKKGDSANLLIDSIIVSDNNKITWKHSNKNYVLESATDYTNNWVADSSKIIFRKNDIGTLGFEITGQEKFMLKKTLPLSTFLVRSFYDYQHGTKLAFDQTDFTKKYKP